MDRYFILLSEIMTSLSDPATVQGYGPSLSRLQDDPRSLRQRVFEYVRAEGTAARSDITAALDVSAGSTTSVTADLIALGLLREVSVTPLEQGRGRPRVGLSVVPEAGFVIGIKLSDKTHTAVLADFSGRTIADVSRPAAPGRQALTGILDEIAALLQTLSELAGKKLAEIDSVGIGISGIVDHEAGIVHWSPLLQDRNEALRDAFKARFNLPVHLDNDSNLLTLAELWFGVGRSMNDFAVVTIENGVGMGLVLNNRLYRGIRGMGLELGHTKVQLDGALCRCGRRGCLEAYLADYALVREAATALGHAGAGSGDPKAMLENLFEQAKTGNRAARLIFDRAARYLAVGLSNVVQLFDPELIILAGERMQYDYLYAETVLAEVQSLTLSPERTPCRIETHAWGDLVWARGATALALSALTGTRIAAGADAV